MDLHRITAEKIFIITYITYAAYYLARLSLSVALPEIGRDLGYSKFELGIIGGAFSIVYALGQFINGQLADSFGPKRIISFGLAMSAIVSSLFGYSETFIVLVLLWGINGYFQSTGWPSAVKIIRNWFGERRIGLVGGIFGSCFLVGNMISWIVLGYVVSIYGWRFAFIVPMPLLVSLAALFHVVVSDAPQEQRENGTNQLQKLAGSLRKIMFSRKILAVAGAYVLLQFVRSGFTLWAPSYVIENYGLSPDLAGYTVAVIPIGGIIGSITTGWLSERLNSKGIVGRIKSMVLLTFCLILVLAAMHFMISYGIYICLILLFLGGLTLYGPHTTMATIVPMDFEKEYGAAGVAGVIDGLGYLGLTLADPFIGWVVDTYSWNGAICFWLFSSIFSTLLLCKIMLEELKQNI